MVFTNLPQQTNFFIPFLDNEIMANNGKSHKYVIKQIHDATAKAVTEIRRAESFSSCTKNCVFFYSWQLRKRLHFWCSSNNFSALLILTRL